MCETLGTIHLNGFLCSNTLVVSSLLEIKKSSLQRPCAVRQNQKVFIRPRVSCLLPPPECIVSVVVVSLMLKERGHMWPRPPPQVVSAIWSQWVLFLIPGVNKANGNVIVCLKKKCSECTCKYINNMPTTTCLLLNACEKVCIFILLSYHKNLSLEEA